MDFNASPRKCGNQRRVWVGGLEPLLVGFVTQNQRCGWPVDDNLDIAWFGGHAARCEQIEIARDPVETTVDPVWPTCLAGDFEQRTHIIRGGGTVGNLRHGRNRAIVRDRRVPRNLSGCGHANNQCGGAPQNE